jgi:hypothetical protein
VTLRSDRWVRGDDEVALDSRVALKMAGAAVDAAGGRPIIGLANSSVISILATSPSRTTLRRYAKALNRRAVSRSSSR